MIETVLESDTNINNIFSSSHDFYKLIFALFSVIESGSVIFEYGHDKF